MNSDQVDDKKFTLSNTHTVQFSSVAQSGSHWTTREVPHTFYFLRVVDEDKLIYSKELTSKTRQINKKQRSTIDFHFTIPSMHKSPWLEHSVGICCSMRITLIEA